MTTPRAVERAGGAVLDLLNRKASDGEIKDVLFELLRPVAEFRPRQH